MANDRNQRLLDQEQQHTFKGLDLEEARRQQEMKLAHDQQQSDSQRLHDLAMAHQQADLAERAQFMKPEEGEE